jgi:hypothetical protein
MISDHLLGKGADTIVFRFLQGLLGGLDIEKVRRIDDMGNLRIGWFCGLLGRTRSHGEQTSGQKGSNNEDLLHDMSFRSGSSLAISCDRQRAIRWHDTRRGSRNADAARARPHPDGRQPSGC